MTRVATIKLFKNHRGNRPPPVELEVKIPYGPFHASSVGCRGKPVGTARAIAGKLLNELTIPPNEGDSRNDGVQDKNQVKEP